MPRWVTVFGRVKHLDAEPGTQNYSAWACPLWQAGMSTAAKAGGINRHIAWYTTPCPWSCSVRWWLKGLASGDQRRLTGSGSALEAITRNTNPRLYFTLLCISKRLIQYRCFLCLRHVRLASGGVMCSTCPSVCLFFVRLSVRSFVCHEHCEHDTLKKTNSN